MIGIFYFIFRIASGEEALPINRQLWRWKHKSPGEVRARCLQQIYESPSKRCYALQGPNKAQPHYTSDFSCVVLETGRPRKNRQIHLGVLSNWVLLEAGVDGSSLNGGEGQGMQGSFVYGLGLRWSFVLRRVGSSKPGP